MAYPEALNNNVSIPKTNYTFSWKLENLKDFNKLHKVLVVFNI